MKENDPLKKSLIKAVLAAMENIAFEEPEVLSESVDITGETITFSLRVVSPYLLQTRIVVPKELVMKLVKTIYRDEESKINLKGAPIIIAGGYGMGSKQNFQLLHELAHVIGGEVAGSRAAVDAGFIPHERQVGQTGVTVRPKLYIACAISGAIQHRAGMEDSNKIIAINTDPEAPIFDVCHYGIVGDAVAVIPNLIDVYKHKLK